MGWNARESGSDRVALAQEAGMGRVSLLGVAAGVLVAYGAFAVLIALVSTIATAISDDVDLPNLNWEQLGLVASVLVAVVLLVSYFFGGYVAGRMARRAGLLNGALVLVVSVAVAVAVTVLANVAVDNEDAILANLRNIGIPTSSEEWGDVFTVAGVASLVAMVAGALLGGLLGERWHGKLIRRAMDPSVGPQARPRAAAPASPPPPSRQEEPTAVGSGPAGPQSTGWAGSRPWAERTSTEPAPPAEPAREPAEDPSGPASRRGPRDRPLRAPRQPG